MSEPGEVEKGCRPSSLMAAIGQSEEFHCKERWQKQIKIWQRSFEICISNSYYNFLKNLSAIKEESKRAVRHIYLVMCPMEITAV